jgi:hypothetical protein
MKAIIECRDGFLFVVEEDDDSLGRDKRWFPVRRSAGAHEQTLSGRSVKRLDSGEGTYVDEEGNVYQLAEKGETKPSAVDHLSKYWRLR